MSGEFLEALQQIAKEKDIPLDTLIETVESALATAYKKNNPVCFCKHMQYGYLKRVSIARCKITGAEAKKNTFWLWFLL